MLYKVTLFLGYAYYYCTVVERVDTTCDSSIACVHNVQYMSIITQNGSSPLQTAAGMGCTDVVVELVKNGANLNLQNEVCRYIQ